MKTYSIVEIFRTLQGEGVHAGTPAIFVRFGGCNMWSGHDENRERDSHRNGAACPLWCDTAFTTTTNMTAQDIVAQVQKLAVAGIRLVVLTGGEPLLQVDSPLLSALTNNFFSFFIAVETNGSIEPLPNVRALINWITCSPKQAPERIRLRRANELKVVYPSYSPEAYEKVIEAQHKYVQPAARTMSKGKSVINHVITKSAIDWVLENPTWKLSVQTQKVLDIP